MKIFVLLLSALVAHGADAIPERLTKRAAGDTPLMSDLRELCDTVGGRPTGSPAYDRAVDWAVSKFKELGVSVRTEPFPVPALWLPESATAEAVAPVRFSLRLAAAPYSPGVRAESRLLDAGEGSPEDFQKLGSQSRGAILLIRNKEMKTFDDLFAEYFRNPGLVEAARQAGAAALLMESTRPRGLLYRHPMSLGVITPTPAAIVSREHAERLARLAAKGEVRVRLDIRNRTGPAYQSRNVVAEVRGSEKPDEVILIGAHLDSWDLGTGAEDNGVNCALVIDVARAFRQLGIRPSRTVRFVLFGGEEQGMWGSAGYVTAHKSELEGHRAAVIFDSGSGALSGFYLNGREELRTPVNAALAAAGIGATSHLPDVLDGTDSFDFLLSGIPNLVGIQDPIPYLADYHAESDVFERSNETTQKATAAAAAVVVQALADSDAPLPPRQSRAEVESLIRATKLDEQMKGFGQWDDWVARRRGVSK